MRPRPTWLLGSLLFVVGACSSTTNPAGMAAYRAPGGTAEPGTGAASSSSEGTSDPGVRSFGAEPMGALAVETVPTVRPSAGGASMPASDPADAAPPAPVRNAPRPPPPPPPPSRPPPEPTVSHGARHPLRPPPPAVLPASVAASVEAPWPLEPYPADMGTPPMPPRPRSHSEVLGTPPAGELPPPESRRLPR